MEELSKNKELVAKKTIAKAFSDIDKEFLVKNPVINDEKIKKYFELLENCRELFSTINFDDSELTLMMHDVMCICSKSFEISGADKMKQLCDCISLCDYFNVASLGGGAIGLHFVVEDIYTEKK